MRLALLAAMSLHRKRYDMIAFAIYNLAKPIITMRKHFITHNLPARAIIVYREYSVKRITLMERAFFRNQSAYSRRNRFQRGVAKKQTAIPSKETMPQDRIVTPHPRFSASAAKP